MTENRNFAVGVFVSGALLLFVAFTVWISGNRGDEPTTFYSVLFKNNVSGLMLGGPVFFLGVEVGNVREVAIVPGDPVLIRVDIEVFSDTPINQGTWATLAAQGITGVSVINLSSDPGEHPPLAATPGYAHPLIPARDTGFSAILSSAPLVLQKLERLLDRASQLFDEENRERVAGALDNVATITQSLASEEGVWATLPRDLEQAVAEIRQAVATLQSLVDEASPGVVTSLENFENATDQLAGATAELEDLLKANRVELDRFVDQGLAQVPGLLEEARATLRDMEKLAERLREDPSQLIYQPDLQAVPVEE